MKKKFALALSLMMAGTTVLGACSSSDNAEKDGGAEETKNFKVGMVTDTGGVDDKSFNQTTWEGLQEFAKSNNLTVDKDVRYLQSQSDADYLNNLTTFAESGTDLTYGVGFLLTDAIAEVAAQFPEQKFALIDSVVDAENVVNITFKEHEGSFLVGVVAGLTTKSNKIGFVGGVDSELIKKFEYGFKAGIKAVNPKAEVVVQYAGDFNKPEKGSSIAASLYGQGTDVIYHAAGNTGNGVFTEAKNRKKNGENVWVIGVDRDQHEEGMPENVTLTSMVKRVDIAVQDISKAAMDGSFPGGEIKEFGLGENGVAIAPTQDNVSEEAKKQVEDFTAKIKSGELKVPANEEEFKTFEVK